MKCSEEANFIETQKLVDRLEEEEDKVAHILLCG